MFQRFRGGVAAGTPSVTGCRCCQFVAGMQQTRRNGGSDHCRLRLVNLEAQDNHISHETQGLSEGHLVVRRGKPFKLTLLLRGRPWNPRTDSLVMEVLLDSGQSEKMLVQSSGRGFNPNRWSARIYPGDMQPMSLCVHVCSPALSPVALYQLLVHIDCMRDRSSYTAGSFVLLCNPWLKDDTVYMPLDAHIQEYIKSDYGLIFKGTHVNVHQQPWSFGQYEPGVLEACLKVLQVSPQHLSDKHQDYILRADPIYLSRVACAMVNSNDDLGILDGRWQGSYSGGVKPTDWSNSADILHRWASSNCCPVRYGQCWVFASVLCTVMRVLGIPSRVVTVFNAAHDSDGNLVTEEFYSSTGEKLGISKDSIWNFHVWVECWMRRPDLGSDFDGWQVVDPTPQERSAGAFRCGPCPVAAVQHHCFGHPFDTAFIYASVDSDLVRMIVRGGLVVERTVDTEWVGQLIYTKSVGSDRPENLTPSYKRRKRKPAVCQRSPQNLTALTAVCHTFSSAADNDGLPCRPYNRTSTSDLRRADLSAPVTQTSQPACLTVRRVTASSPGPKAADYETGETLSSLEVSLSVDGEPLVGQSISVCVTVTNQSSSSRVLMEHLNAQLKRYNGSPQQSFWKTHKQVSLKPHGALTLRHTIPPSDYESVLSGDNNIIKLAVVMKDEATKERVLATQDFSISSPEITIEVEGGDSIQVKKEHAVRVSFTNRLCRALTGALLTVEGSGLFRGTQEARLAVLRPDSKLEKEVSIMATSSGTKVLMATFSHSGSSSVVSRSFHKVSVRTE